jgi:hypothetical protein
MNATNYFNRVFRYSLVPCNCVHFLYTRITFITLPFLRRHIFVFFCLPKLTGILCSLFSVILRRLHFMCRRFGTNSVSKRRHIEFMGRGITQNKECTRHMRMDLTERSETSAHKIQTSGNHPKERLQHSQHSESLKLGDMLLLQSQHFHCHGPYARKGCLPGGEQSVSQVRLVRFLIILLVLLYSRTDSSFFFF